MMQRLRLLSCRKASLTNAPQLRICIFQPKWTSSRFLDSPPLAFERKSSRQLSTVANMSGEKMRAILVDPAKNGADRLYLGETDKPRLRDGQVLVKNKAFGLNRADTLQREGKYPPPPGASQILGMEFTGVIESVGPKVTNWKVGDEVFGLTGGGAYAEYIAAEATHLIPKPSDMKWVIAAGITECFLTAFQALVSLSDLKRDEDVLVHAGASGVGLAATQLARGWGARRVIVTASSKEKLDFLLSLPDGATHAINYKTEDFAEKVKEITQNKGVNVLIDFVGQSHWNKNLKSLGVDGRMVMLAGLSGFNVQETSLSPILMKRLSIMGSTLRARSLEYQANLIDDFKKDVLPKFEGTGEGNGLKVIIHKVYSWKEAAEAHRELEGNASIGKIVLEID